MKYYLLTRCKQDPITGCWNWTKSLTKKGYGQFGYKGKVVKAHRLSFITFVGPIPENLFICHTCNNRACINPAHLYAGNVQDNANDRVIFGRPNLKLSKEQVAEIRIRSTESQHQLATEYGVAQSTIGKILNGKLRVRG